jgi:hypothetical protein
MQKANVSLSKIKMDKMDKMVRRRGKLPRHCRSRSLYIGRVVRDVVLMSKERKKVMKKQRRSK